MAETPVNIALAGSRISAVLQGYMALASHSGSCDGCGDQCSRQKFKISIPFCVLIHKVLKEAVMGRGLLLWLLGVPIPVIILLWLFFGH